MSIIKSNNVSVVRPITEYDLECLGFYIIPDLFVSWKTYIRNWDYERNIPRFKIELFKDGSVLVDFFRGTSHTRTFERLDELLRFLDKWNIHLKGFEKSRI